MPRGLILCVLIASHQNSATWRMQGSASVDFQPLAASTLLSREPTGMNTSQLLVQADQNQVNQLLFIDMPPTKPYFTLRSACSFLLSVTMSAQVLGSSVSLTRSVR